MIVVKLRPTSMRIEGHAGERVCAIVSTVVEMLRTANYVSWYRPQRAPKPSITVVPLGKNRPELVTVAIVQLHYVAAQFPGELRFE